MESDFTVRPVEPQDRDWVLDFLTRRWGSERMVRHGEVLYPSEHHGFLARYLGNAAGLLTYQIVGDACEITLIDSDVPGAGIGSALLVAVQATARRQACARLWLVTTNDNLDALRFYQKRGFSIVAVHAGSLEAARRLKPEIPLFGAYDIPLRDEIDLQMELL